MARAIVLENSEKFPLDKELNEATLLAHRGSAVHLCLRGRVA